MFEPDAQYITALMLLGLGWAFVRADPHSTTSGMLAIALANAGLAILANVMLVRLNLAGPLPAWARWLIVPEVIAFCATFEWVHRVRGAIPSGALRTRFGDGVLRVGQALILLYGYNGWHHADLRIEEFFGGLKSTGLFEAEVFRLFVAPLEIAMLLWILSITMCLKRDPEAAERVRLIGFVVAVPLITLALVLPARFASIATVLGLIVMLGGALKHAQLKGRQGQFMSRFLSPQVANLVNRSGLGAAMREQRRDLSIVCVDLRGFSAYASAQDSPTVIALLREYYDAVGAAAFEFEATIKDYAGDGVMLLLGAPVAMEDHASRAVLLAQQILTRVRPVTAARSSPAHVLGCGLGVASGSVTVGIIGGEGRLEYAAVGAAVNLAARLCEEARDGEILIAAETRTLLGDTADGANFLAREALQLKGFPEPVSSYTLSSSPALA